MSGANWLPSWTLDPRIGAGRFRTISEDGESPYGIGDFYTNERLLAAQFTFVRAVGRRARGRDAVLVWDIGNEFSNLRAAETPSEGASWSARLTHELTRVSKRPVTGGIHGDDVSGERGLRPSTLCAPWDLATMHGYPAYSEFARGVDDPEVVPFLCELIAGLARKPVLFSEFGNPQCPSQGSAMPCLDEAAMADYAYAVLDRLHDRGALGALWWCWTDYAHALAQTPPFDRAPHELRFGLVRNDGSPKPVAAALRAFARERREIRPSALRALVDETVYYAHLPTSLANAYRNYVATREATR
jgi:endo-1,4-beta-mannosidase